MRSPKGCSSAVMAADLLLLTLLLYFSGGPFNPFNFLYLVHIALAAVVLRSRFTWALAALSFLCFGALFLEQSFQESHAHAGHGGGGALRAHRHGAAPLRHVGRVRRRGGIHRLLRDARDARPRAP